MNSPKIRTQSTPYTIKRQNTVNYSELYMNLETEETTDETRYWRDEVEITKKYDTYRCKIVTMFEEL